MMKFIKDKIINEYKELRLLLSKLSTLATAVFILNVVLMNFLANKEIALGLDWAAFDCGIVISWFAFLYMDVVTRNYGAKAAIRISATALFVNLIVSILFFAVSFIPGNWSQFYVFANSDINTALDNTIRSSWYIILGSSIAFLVSFVLNALLNQAIGKMFKNYSVAEYMCRTYISTFISQFVDNMIFALIVSHFLFGWNLCQCLVCALVGCTIECLCEIIFSPFGYSVSEKIRKKQKQK